MASTVTMADLKAVIDNSNQNQVFEEFKTPIEYEEFEHRLKNEEFEHRLNMKNSNTD